VRAESPRTPADADHIVAAWLRFNNHVAYKQHPRESRKFGYHSILSLPREIQPNASEIYCRFHCRHSQARTHA